jgi:hypothetical protein
MGTNMLRARSIALFPFALLLTACSSSSNGDSSEITGTALAEVTNAPVSVRCAIIKVAGSKTVTQSFDIAPETSSVFDLQGLPFGKDTFTAKAYTTGCAAVTASSPATWVSDSVVADVEANQPPTVTLQMVSPDGGGATVGLNFPTPRGTITEFPLPSAGSNPSEIATGPDGNL